MGAPATYAVWEPGPLVVQAPDGRVAAWSTDPRSGTPPLPDLSAEAPRCWRTVRDGVAISTDLFTASIGIATAYLVKLLVLPILILAAMLYLLRSATR